MQAGEERAGTPCSRVYLDWCCICRPTDDQRQPRIRDEAAAVVSLIAMCDAGGIELASSSVLLMEIGRIASEDRRELAQRLVTRSRVHIRAGMGEVERARELQTAGVAPVDALHVASAEAAAARYFVTVDDRLRRRLVALRSRLLVEAVDPIECLERVSYGRPGDRR